MEAQLALAQHTREPRAARGAQYRGGDPVLLPHRFRAGGGGFAVRRRARFLTIRFVPLRGFASARSAAARRWIARQRPAVELQIVGIGRRDELEGLRTELIFELR